MQASRRSALGGISMAWFTRIVLALAVVVMTGVTFTAGQEPPGSPHVKVEFRWAEEKPVEELTEAKGIDLSCSDKKAYLHKKAVLTNQDITEAHLRKANTVPDDKFIIEVKLTRDAGKKMAKSSEENLNKPLVVLVDGKVAAAMVVTSRLSDFLPITGFFTEAEADRIIKGMKAISF